MNDRHVAEDAMATQAAPAPGGGEALVNLRQQEIERQVDRVLAEMPDSRLAAQRLIADVFGPMPSAEMLHAFTQVAETEAKPEVQVDLERGLLVMRLMVDLEIHGLTKPGTLDRQTLDGASWRLPELIRRVEEFRRASDWDPPDLGLSELEQLGKLRKMLMPDTQDLQAFALVIPQVTRLAAAVRDGQTDEIQSLTQEDADLFRRALPGAPEATPDRILLYAVALRWTIQEHLHAWAETTPAEKSRDTSDGEADEPSAAEGRQAVRLEDLELDVNAYQVLSKRLQADQDTARSAGQDDLVQQLSAAQRALFTVYLELTPVIRNPAGAAVDADDPAAAEARARILQEIQQAEERTASAQTEKEETLLDALTAVRDGRNRSADIQLPPGARNLKRERLRRRALIGVAAVVAIAAVIVNLLLLQRGGRATPIDIRAGEFASAMPLNAVTPLGSTMFSEISAPDWERMPEDERMRRLQQLGSLAQEKGFKRVLLLDDSKNELAKWSAQDGVRILQE